MKNLGLDYIPEICLKFSAFALKTQNRTRFYSTIDISDINWPPPIYDKIMCPDDLEIIKLREK